MRVIAVINQKGGVGKTTSCINLAHALSLQNHSVMTIDLDPQAHLSAGLGANAHHSQGADQVLLHQKEVFPYLESIRPKLQLLPAGKTLSQVELPKNHDISEETLAGDCLSNALQRLDHNPEFILMDCPPATGILLKNALYASSELVIPVAADYLALRGLSYLMEQIQQTAKERSITYKYWIVVTRFHSRRRLANDVVCRLKEHFPGKVLATPIREAVALAECPSFGQSIFEYKSRSNGARDYGQLSMDLLQERVM